MVQHFSIFQYSHSSTATKCSLCLLLKINESRGSFINSQNLIALQCLSLQSRPFLATSWTTAVTNHSSQQWGIIQNCSVALEKVFLQQFMLWILLLCLLLSHITFMYEKNWSKSIFPLVWLSEFNYSLTFLVLVKSILCSKKGIHLVLAHLKVRFLTSWINKIHQAIFSPLDKKFYLKLFWILRSEIKSDLPLTAVTKNLFLTSVAFGSWSKWNRGFLF